MTTDRTSFIEQEDQWGTRGYRIVDGKIVSFDDDRKEQTSSSSAPMDPHELYDRLGEEDEELKKWIRLNFGSDEMIK